MLSTALALGVCALRHNDDSDAQLYSVVARNMVRDETWTQLSYAPNVHPVFREHLPFGFWPGALAVKLGGEALLPWVGVMWTLGTLLVVAWLARRLQLSAPIAVLALLTTESFTLMNAAFRLDAPLIFFALLAAAPALVSARPPWFSFLPAAIAVLIKGPFGLVPIVAAGLARALHRDGRWRWLSWTFATAFLACAPLAAFLAFNRDWQSGWLEQQVIASALGTRTDGHGNPFLALAEHCWPWLPLTLLGCVSKRTRTLSVWLLFMLVALALPARKLWHHTLIVFPACALLAAAALERVKTRITAPTLAFLGAVTVTWLALSPRGRAASCTEFASTFSKSAREERVLVLREPNGKHWREISTLTFEHHLAPWLVDDAEALTKRVARLALVPKQVEAPALWKEVASTRGWKLLEREPLTQAQRLEPIGATRRSGYLDAR